MSCPSSSTISSADPCTRSYVQSSLPLIPILCTLLYRIPPATAFLPERVRKATAAVRQSFSQFLHLSEAETLLGADPTLENFEHVTGKTKPRALVWRTASMCGLALLESISWLAIASYLLTSSEESTKYRAVSAFLSFLSWLPAVVIPAARPTLTPPWDLFSFYLLQLACGIWRFGALWYDRDTQGITVQSLDVIATTANLLAVLLLLLIVLRMPLNVPRDSNVEERIGKDISPEDYTPLWSWITFEWVYPLIRKGTNETLNEDDVWELSPTIQSKPVYLKFAGITRKSLLRRLWVANSLDLILDFLLTLVSVSLNYCGPFFLKRILDSFTDDSPEARPRAYVYASLAFLTTILKAQADLIHLWLGRRAGTRMRSELMASIYAKALVRKDYSGIVEQKNEKAGRGNGDRKKFNDGDKDDVQKNTAGADIGKIVNLMSGDANRISQIVSGAYFIYGGPFEIIIASIFLYRLLGLSAFAGFLVLSVGSPLNSYLAKRTVRIQKSSLAARDRRMGVLNELITAVKLVKFYGWENRWIGRVMEKRSNEMRWLIKSRINQIMFSMLWSTGPILVSIVAFFAYVKTGHELTIPTAFTAIALFNMLRTPLNVIPAWIVQGIQTYVAIGRITTFLGEDEVTAQVSGLKRQETVVGALSPEDQWLGIRGVSFKWNEVDREHAKNQGESSSGNHKKGVSLVDESESLLDDRASVNSGQEGHFELRDINVIFPQGQLTLITGPTASGKTALLMALLGELSMLPGEGKILLPKFPKHIDEHGLAYSISFAAQMPWLQHLSIRDNILFGSPFDEERYNAVLECCALKPDIEILEDGDMTEIGSRGISLSGGQKARVALARAVYARTKFVLLDDPLSAVDSNTARFLYDKLFLGPLLANRTVLLVTHHVNLVLPGAHYLIRMLDGRIDVQGTVEELRSQGVLEAISSDSSLERPYVEKEPQSFKKQGEQGGPETDKKKAGKLVKDEAREMGSVKWRIYKTYMKATSYYTWAILAFSIIVFQLLGVGEKLWIKQWGEAYNQTSASFTHAIEHSSVVQGEGDLLSHEGQLSALFTSAIGTMEPNTVTATTFPSAATHPLYYVAIYALIGLSAAMVSVTSNIIQITGSLRASRILFKQLLETVVRATMRWHDSTPTGRILNRFQKDIETVDTSLSSSLQSVNSALATFFSSVIIVIVFSPGFIPAALIIGYIYYFLGVGYLNTGRDLRRMESNSRSPIFANFSELLDGIVTVRAFSSEKRFLDNLHSKIDITTKMWYMFWMTNRWLLLHFDFLGGLAVYLTTLLALGGTIGAGFAGITITSAMAFTTSVYWTCRFWTQLELDLNSVERVVEYLELPQEPPTVIESSRPPAYWPSTSNDKDLVLVENLVVRYAPELPAVLHDVSFALKSRERVGLLGRTGSGKSTLAMSLLRFTDPSSGSIVIDGIDITKIGLHDLRSRITLVSQDPIAFSGTIRENIDPFDDYSDEECLDALARVHLLTASRIPSEVSSRITSPDPEDVVASSSTSTASRTVTPQQDDKQRAITLETQVSTGGINFSQGQRQLLAMARALLRQSSIIVLDEATSSIDFATDKKIQATIREEFKNSLLLTIAHRLRTVIDYDRLIVLDKGRIVEFDTPLNLIRKDGGYFREMCLQSGTFKELEEAAMKAAAAAAQE